MAWFEQAEHWTHYSLYNPQPVTTTTHNFWRALGISLKPRWEGREGPPWLWSQSEGGFKLYFTDFVSWRIHHFVPSTGCGWTFHKNSTIVFETIPYMHVNNEISYCLCLPHFIIENQRRSWGILQIRRKNFKYVYTKEGHRPPLYTLPYPSDIFQTPPRHLSEHLPDTFKTPSRHPPDTFQTPSRHSLDTLHTPCRHPPDALERTSWHPLDATLRYP